MLAIPGHGAFSESLLSQDTKQARARELLRNTSNEPQASEITVTIWRTFKISRIMISHHDGSAFPVSGQLELESCDYNLTGS